MGAARRRGQSGFIFDDGEGGLLRGLISGHAGKHHSPRLHDHRLDAVFGEFKGSSGFFSPSPPHPRPQQDISAKPLESHAFHRDPFRKSRPERRQHRPATDPRCHENRHLIDAPGIQPRTGQTPATFQEHRCHPVIPCQIPQQGLRCPPWHHPRPVRRRIGEKRRSHRQCLGPTADDDPQRRLPPVEIRCLP